MKDASDTRFETMAGLSRSAWVDKLQDITEPRGWFRRLGTRHMSSFVEAGTSLLVTFESIQGIQALSDTGHPVGFDLVRRPGVSHLCVISDGDTWFRDPAVYSHFDTLIDEGFFDDFDDIVFYGAGPCGYAAAAFCVAAPGATVIAVQPQATLDPTIAGWDPRFSEHRRTSFTDRYGYAPDMLEAASRAFVVFDPAEQLDAMHAALFMRNHVTPLRMRRMGDALQTQLIALGLLNGLLVQAIRGFLTPLSFARALRARRNHPPYLRRLLTELDAQDRPLLTRYLCQNVVGRLNAPRFTRRLEQLNRAETE